MIVTNYDIFLLSKMYLKVKDMVVANTFIVMALFTTANGKVMSLLDMVYAIMLMEIDMKVIFKINITDGMNRQVTSIFKKNF